MHNKRPVNDLQAACYAWQHYRNHGHHTAFDEIQPTITTALSHQGLHSSHAIAIHFKDGKTFTGPCSPHAVNYGTCLNSAKRNGFTNIVDLD